jgi:hypothetical protein
MIIPKVINISVIHLMIVMILPHLNNKYPHLNNKYLHLNWKINNLIKLSKFIKIKYKPYNINNN